MYQVKTIESGYFLADGGAMFGAVPKRSWTRKYAETGDNLCALAMRCVLAISANRNILVDLGMGDKYLDKVDYYQPYDLTNLSDELAKQGLLLTDITDVVLTHLHFDHCGYATTYNEQGEAVPTFPNASYWLSREQWNTYISPSRLEQDAIFAEDVKPLYDAGLLHIIDEDIQLDANCLLQLYGGHSSGQIVPIFDTVDGKVAFPSDLIPTSAHVSLDWISAYDLSALVSVKEKERFLAQAVEQDYQLIYYHDAYTVSSRVKRLNDTYIAYSKTKID